LLMLVCAVTAAQVRADDLRAAVQLDTGAFYIWSEGPTDFNLTSYTLTSGDSQLLSGNWLPIANNYDASAGGMVDEDDNWLVISQTPADLSEGEFLGDGGLLTPLQPISLGNVWLMSGTRQLALTATEGNLNVVPVNITYILPGDFDADEDVDMDDYTVWRSGFGITTGGSFVVGDGNGDGRVDVADYTVWRDNLGATSSLPGALGLATAVSIPEPATVMLAGIALVGVIVRRRFAARPAIQG
jgi:hypothetical protein